MSARLILRWVRGEERPDFNAHQAMKLTKFTRSDLGAPLATISEPTVMTLSPNLRQQGRAHQEDLVTIFYQQAAILAAYVTDVRLVMDDIAASKTQRSLRPAARDGINSGSGHCAMPTRKIHDVVNVVKPRKQMQPERSFKENLVQGSNTVAFLMGTTLSSHPVNVTLPLPDKCSDS